MALLKTSTTMLLLTSQNVARCAKPTPSRSTTDWQAKLTVFFTELGFHHNRFTLLSPARSILPCPDAHSWRAVKLSHLFHGTPLPEGLTNPRFFLKKHFLALTALYWLQSTPYWRFIDCCATQHQPKLHRLQVLSYKNEKILDLSSFGRKSLFDFFRGGVHQTSGSRY